VTDEPDIDAIPTTYAGTDFRSRLEARWATFLDSHRIIWQYEPETITLPSGTVYVPDFWLPELGTWIEVKGTGVPRIEKAVELGKTRVCRCEDECTCTWPGGELVLIGHPPKRYEPWRDPEMQNAHYAAVTNAGRRHGGYPAWSTATGRAAWLGVCPNCCLTGWFSGHLLQCRACRKRPTSGHLYAVVDTALRFPKDVAGLVPGISSDPDREAIGLVRIGALHAAWLSTFDKPGWW
jgi:hypothetical protein